MTAIATRPLVFNNTVGWLNDAEGSRGVVIAGGHGFEDLCSRRFLSLLAGAISRAGLPVLQFDYPGCGDAIGNHQTTNQLGSWLQAIDNTIDCLKPRPASPMSFSSASDLARCWDIQPLLVTRM